MENFEEQVHAAKTFLLRTSSGTKTNLYDHLSDCLSRVLTEQTPNAVDIFENISDSIKKDRLQSSDDTQEQEGPSDRVDLAEKQKKLFKASDPEDEGEPDEEVAIPFPDLMDIGKAFELGAIGLGREEYFRINLALKELSQSQPLVSVRFWGKIFGTRANYFIAEAEYQEGEGEQEDEEEEDKEEKKEDETEDNSNDGNLEEDMDSDKDEPPKAQWKPPIVIPKEEPKTGANKKTFFVCSNSGDPWIKLPSVTPLQIRLARTITKFFTGNLDASIHSFPPFPGKEINYLRAQIARITATTHISPNGYFQSPEEEEEEEEEKGMGVIEVNPEFEIDKISEFADITNWCHHTSYLLPQGRTVWWNPVQKADDEFDEEEDEDDDEKEQPDEPEPEVGPTLLTSAAEDANIRGMPAWSARLSSNILPQYAVAIASSNLWPGAHAYACGKKYENIYIGWGQKYSPLPLNPALPAAVLDEFPAGADITEAMDPTVEQEKALKAAQEEAQANMEEEEEPDEESDEDD